MSDRSRRRNSCGLRYAVSVALVALFLVASACNSQNDPPSGNQPSGSYISAAKHSHPVLGVDLLAPNAMSASYISTRVLDILRAVKTSLGVSSVSINWYFFSPYKSSNTVESRYDTLTPANMLQIGQEAESLGLSVVMRPLFRLLPCTGTPKHQVCHWGGSILPADPAKWFQSLYQLELPYLRVAAKLHAASFVVESELDRMNTLSNYWTALFHKDALVAPHMAIEAAVDQTTYFGLGRLRPVQVPNDSYGAYGLDFYPVSGYPHAPTVVLTDRHLGPGTTVGALTALMVHLLKKVGSSSLAATRIDESGIPAAIDAYADPADWDQAQSEPSSVEVQANWISAVCGAVWKLGMRGFFLYDVNLDDNAAAWPTSNTNVMGKPASMAAMRGCAALFARAK